MSNFILDIVKGKNLYRSSCCNLSGRKESTNNCSAGKDDGNSGGRCSESDSHFQRSRYFPCCWCTLMWNKKLKINGLPHTVQFYILQGTICFCQRRKLSSLSNLHGKMALLKKQELIRWLVWTLFRQDFMHFSKQRQVCGEHAWKRGKNCSS